jgi:hypothetical protein
MAIKGNKVVDLITGDFHGRWPNEFKNSSHGSLKKPIIRKSGNFRGMETFPIPLDPEENVKTVTSMNGTTFDILVPSTDMHNFDSQKIKETIYGKIAEKKSEKLEEKNERIEELENKVALLRDELDKDDTSSIEEDKYSSSRRSGTTDLRCSSCGNVNSRSDWQERGGGMCPWCGETHIDSAEVVP